MATHEFKLPDVGEGVAEGTLESWLVSVGDTVTEDQPVAEVETDKALVDVPSPYNGTIRELHAEPGDVVPVGDVIVTFETAEADDGAEASAADDDGAAAEGATTEAGAGDGDGAGADPDAATGAGADTDAETTAEADTDAGSGGRVFAAPSTRRLARELDVDLATVEGTGPGGRVTESDVRAAAEDVGEPATPEPEPEPTEQTAAAADGEVIEAPPAVESADRDRTLAAPATRRVAEEEGVDIDAVPAVEERDGEAFVTADAVREYAGAQQRAQAADATALATRGEDAVETVEDTAEDARAVEATQREEREPYRGVRRTIGEQMERSKFTAPHVTHHDEVDVTELVETRERLKEVAGERGISLTYMPFVLKACVAALKEFPYVNAQLDEDNEEIVKKKYYNLGVATATDAGLMVPVVRDVDRKGLLQIASETNELVERARDRKIGPDDMRDGTFTVTNIGGIGGEYATPIVNYPEVAILALGRIKEKPRVVDGEVVPRHVMTLSLSFDHRVIDGAIGARFTNAVKRYLEDPDLLLLE